MADEVSIGVAVLDRLLTFVIGVLIPVGAYFLLRKRKRIKYSTISIPVIKESQSAKLPDGVELAIREALITGIDEHDQMIPIKNAAGTNVVLRNAGNEIVEELVVQITLADDAIIIQQSTEPAGGDGYKVELEIDGTHKNMARVQVPYINVKEKLVVTLFSVRNEDAAKCGVSAFGRGVKVKRESRGWPFVVFLVAMPLWIALASYFTKPDNFPDALEEWLGLTLRTVTSTTTVFDTSWFIGAVTLVPMFAILSFAYYMSNRS